jgi:hypothetical protein
VPRHPSAGRLREAAAHAAWCRTRAEKALPAATIRAGLPDLGGCQDGGNTLASSWFPVSCGRPMEILITSALLYLAVGATCCAHPASPSTPDDFHWKNQVAVFRATLPDVLLWPAALWRLGRGWGGRS